jgi:hypothetical protein
MLSTQNSLVKQAKANEPQAFQSWNNKMNTTPEGMNTAVDKSRQLKYLMYRVISQAKAPDTSAHKE